MVRLLGLGRYIDLTKDTREPKGQLLEARESRTVPSSQALKRNNFSGATQLGIPIHKLRMTSGET